MTHPSLFPARLLFALTLCALCTLVRAQDNASASPSEKPSIQSVLFGWNAYTQADRWTPITVAINGGKKGFSGTLHVTHEQDSTQRAQIIIPCAAGPNQSVPVRFAFCPPDSLRSTKMSLRANGIKEVASADFETSVGDGRPLDLVRQPFRSIIACVGTDSVTRLVPNILRSAPIFRPEDQSIRSWGQVEEVQNQSPADLGFRNLCRMVGAPIPAEDLPVAWAAYDALASLIIDPEQTPSLDARAIDAVRDWVSRGGRLVLVAGRPGGAWRRWLPTGPAGDVFELGEIARFEPPEEMRTHAAQGAAMLKQLFPDEEAPRRALDLIPFEARSLRLTDRGVRFGWTEHWVGPSGAALLAEGPIGHGWVTVLGVDPKTIQRVESKAAIAGLWNDALRNILADRMTQQESQQHWGMVSSGADPAERNAVRLALDRAAGLAPSVVGRANLVAFLIGVSLIGLALLVGPIDAIVLHRMQLRQRSWLTALSWTGVAAAIAYAAPVVGRKNDSTALRVSVIDLIIPKDAAAAPALTGSQASCTGMYGSSPARFSPEQTDAGQWWRGASAAHNTWERQAFFPDFTTLQAPSDPGQPRSNTAVDVAINQWTFRAMLDQGSTTAPLSVRLMRDPENPEQWRVRLSGLPQGVNVAHGVLRVGKSWQTLALGERRDDAAGSKFVTFEGPAMARSMDSGAAWQPAAPAEQAESRVTDPGPLLSLPGAAARAQTVESLLKSGRWAAVYVQLSYGERAGAPRWATSDAIVAGVQTQFLTVVRAVVELDEPTDGGKTP